MSQVPRQFKARIIEKTRLKSDVFLLRFKSGVLSRQASPGEFLQVKTPSCILRRPLSIHRIDNDIISILFRVRGKGTEELSLCENGAYLDAIGPLGSGFSLVNSLKESHENILVAGGMGVAPLVYLAQRLVKDRKARVKRNTVLLGAATAKDILCAGQFRELGFKVKIATDDGSLGLRSTAVGLLDEEIKKRGKGIQANIFACGPKGMFEKIYGSIKNFPGVFCQVSFEQFMGCGLGVCCACVIETRHGYKKVCSDGPVFDLKDIF